MIDHIVILLCFLSNGMGWGFQEHWISCMKYLNGEGETEAIDAKRKKLRNAAYFNWATIGFWFYFLPWQQYLSVCILGWVIFYLVGESVQNLLRKESIWFVGYTLRKNEFPRSPKQAKIFKITLLALAILQYIAALIFL